jgi:NAD(P)H dehydrogenase (quinone)
MARMRIVIIGGGPGGYEAALVAAEHGADVTVVSREGLGGNSVLWDCVPSKALIVSAEAVGWLESAHRLGVRPRAGRMSPRRPPSTWPASWTGSATSA